MERRVPDLSRLKRFTGYEPKHQLDDILRDVIRHLQEKVPQQDAVAIGA
jgi:nucleoside-diphosphate-sugar epimerase